MSQATLRGTVHLIEETKTYGQKGFRKRLVVLEQPGDRFTNYVPVEFIQDGCDTVDRMSVGDEVEVTYRLSGRRWQRDPSSEVKFFLSAEAISYRVVSGKGEVASPDDVNAALDEAAQDEAAQDEAALDEDDDVPF